MWMNWDEPASALDGIDPRSEPERVSTLDVSTSLTDAVVARGCELSETRDLFNAKILETIEGRFSMSVDDLSPRQEIRSMDTNLVHAIRELASDLSRT